MNRKYPRIIKFHLLSFVCLIVLSACNLSSPLELIYYDRVKFSFIDSDGEDKYIYLCSKEKTPEETQLKAEKANKIYVQEMALLIEKVSQEMMIQLKEKNDKKDDDYSIMDGVSMSMHLTKESEVIVEKVEKDYQCILIDIVEIKT